jgi:hypothetical protein
MALSSHHQKKKENDKNLPLVEPGCHECIGLTLRVLLVDALLPIDNSTSVSLERITPTTKNTPHCNKITSSIDF